jgi:hypothetical protein
MLIQLKGDQMILSQSGYINDLLNKYPSEKKIFKPPLSKLEIPLINITTFLSMLMHLMS